MWIILKEIQWFFYLHIRSIYFFINSKRGCEYWFVVWKGYEQGKRLRITAVDAQGIGTPCENASSSRGIPSPLDDDGISLVCISRHFMWQYSFFRTWAVRELAQRRDQLTSFGAKANATHRWDTTLICNAPSSQNCSYEDSFYYSFKRVSL